MLVDMDMTWLWIAGAAIAAFLIFKFLVKPLFKIIAVAVLLVVAWLLYTNL